MEDQIKQTGELSSESPSPDNPAHIAPSSARPPLYVLLSQSPFDSILSPTPGQYIQAAPSALPALQTQSTHQWHRTHAMAPPPTQQLQQGGSRASKPVGSVAGMETGAAGAEERAGSSWAFRAAVAGVAAAGLTGAGVLVWWALAFHPATQQLWMVPVGLVLLGTPLLAWLSLFASSSACRSPRRLGNHHDTPPPPPMPMSTER